MSRLLSFFLISTNYGTIPQCCAQWHTTHEHVYNSWRERWQQPVDWTKRAYRFSMDDRVVLIDPYSLHESRRSHRGLWTDPSGHRRLKTLCNGKTVNVRREPPVVVEGTARVFATLYNTLELRSFRFNKVFFPLLSANGGGGGERHRFG